MRTEFDVVLTGGTDEDQLLTAIMLALECDELTALACIDQKSFFYSCEGDFNDAICTEEFLHVVDTGEVNAAKDYAVTANEMKDRGEKLRKFVRAKVHIIKCTPAPKVLSSGPS